GQVKKRGDDGYDLTEKECSLHKQFGDLVQEDNCAGEDVKGCSIHGSGFIVQSSGLMVHSP
ncbi:MAG: hypothetical protein ACE5EP_04710, partial [Candidatus Methylomirabilales bacterium]